jgi:uncharacterized Ntn-hydrolase superfamily protein
VEGEDPRRGVLTYSIVARDAETGELGAAVQSRAFTRGAGVLWAKPGVGVVATQSCVERQLGLGLLETGKTPEQALAALMTADPDDRRAPGRHPRSERIGRRTYGAACIPDAGHQLGDGFSVQANPMRNTSVWPTMGAFEAALARRLLAALRGAEEARWLRSHLVRRAPRRRRRIRRENLAAVKAALESYRQSIVTTSTGSEIPFSLTVCGSE